MARTMRALVKATREPGLVMQEVPVPEIGPNDVLIRIHKSAICGTDMHIWNWDAWAQKTIPVPMHVGHEYVGLIEAVGSEVEGYKVGDRVSGEGHIVCGHCRNCRAGNGHWCKFTKGVGVNRDGAFAEYLCIPETNVIAVPKTTPEEIVAFYDAYGNACHTATMFDVTGEDVLITGAGPIGMMAVGICRQNGARRIVVTDVNDYRLDIAKKMGASATVNLKNQTVEDAMKELHIIEGFDVGCEMSGNGAALNQMLKLMRNGGKVALLGIAGPGTVIDWNDVIFKGLTLQGIYGRKMYETWYKMMAMVEAGLDLSPVLTHRFHYTQFEEAFAVMNSGQSGKVVLDWTEVRA
jgi:threonine 3-dehydrogenase